MAGKSERYKIREMELDYELQMQREKRLMEFALTPPGIYLIGLGGSIVMTYLGAMMTPEEKKSDDMKSLLEKGLGAAMAGSFGVGGMLAEKMTGIFSGAASGENPLNTLFKLTGMGASGLFTLLLILNEMKPDGGSSQGGIMGALTGGLA